MIVTSRRRLLGLAVAAVGLFLLLTSAAAQAASCNDFWKAPGGGDWSASANWTNGVPTASTNVCLDNTQVPDGYTVDIDTYNPALVANSITVGGAAGHTITLAILGTGGGVQVGNTLTLSDQGAGAGVTPYGAITLGSDTATTTQPGAIVVTSGTLVNQGTITSEPTGNPAAYNTINGSFDNQGTLNVDWLFSSAVTTWTDSGTINVATGQTVALNPSAASSSFTQTGGTIANHGTFQFNGSGGIFVATGGSATGNPLILESGTVDPSGSGSGLFHLENGSAMLGSNIGKGYIVWSSGIPGYSHGDLTTTGSLTNYGRLELGSLDGTHGTLTVPSGSFTNDGTLIFDNTANGPDGLAGSLVNHGTVSAMNPVQGTGVITNYGTFALAPTATFQATSFAQGSGGTTVLDITGGSSPMVPELQLSGAAALGGRLDVSSSGTAKGTFPVIGDATRKGTFATTKFTGESYASSYSAAGLSLTGPAKASTSAGRLTVQSIRGGAGDFTVKLSCVRGSACSYSVRATAAKRTVGSARGKLSAGATKLLTVKVKPGFRSREKVTVVVKSGLKVTRSATVTVTRPERK